LSAIYRAPSNRQMCDSAIKPTSPAYKFETRSDLLLDSYPTLRFRGCRYAFETFEEYERSVGLGTLLEQRASMGKHTYTGRVAVVPVPGTYSKKAKLWMAYHLQLSVDKNPRSPALVVGDSIIINFDPNGIDLKTAWKGKITEAVDATSIGQLNVTVKRPHDKGTVLPLDSEEHSVLTVKDFTTMEHSSVLRNWSRNNSKKSVVIYTNNDEKGCKRLMNNFSKLKVPHKLRDTYPAKAAALKAGTELLLMNNFTQLKRSELFKNIDAGQWTQARQILVTYLRDYQLSAFLEMEDNGLYENTACVIGSSGSGKFYLALTIAVAYKEYRIKKAAMRAAKEACIEVEPEAKPSSPKDNPAPPKPEEDSPETYTKQPGRITFCGIQNDTVDEVYRVLSTVTPKLMNEMEMPPKLVLRIHSSSSEIDAVVAMSRLFFDRDEKELPYYYNPNIEVTDGLPVSLLGAYLTHYRGTSDTSLCNRRMKEVDGSAANYILELANDPDFPRSPEVLATFTSGELTDLEDKLTPILRAREQLLMNGDVMDNDIKRAVKSAAKTGHYALLEKAAANVANIMPSVLLFSPSRSVHYVVSGYRDVIQRCPSDACSVLGRGWPSKRRRDCGILLPLLACSASHVHRIDQPAPS
jgi:hypothetical protein